LALVALRFKVLGRSQKKCKQGVISIKDFVTNFRLFASSRLLQIFIILKIENLCHLQFVKGMSFF